MWDGGGSPSVALYESLQNGDDEYRSVQYFLCADYDYSRRFACHNMGEAFRP